MTTSKPCKQCEELRRFLEAPGAPSVAEFRELAGAKQDAQVRHWRDGVRRPRPKTAVRIERITGGVVPRHVWYPDDWQEIWPEYLPTGSSAEVSHG